MRKNSSGFTLLEVMIVITILATLTVLSSQNIQQAIRTKVKIQEQLDDTSQVRDALKIIERDINLAFHYRDLETEMKALIKKQRDNRGGATTTTLPNTPPPPPQLEDPNDPLTKKSENRQDPTTHFIGKEEELTFPTMNAGRISESQTQGDFIVVGYAIKPCRKPGAEGVAPNDCLIRRVLSVVEGDITKGGEDIVLLEDVSEFKFRYFGKGKPDWNSQWDSLQGDAITKNKFPEAVEISMTIEKDRAGKKKKISMQLVVPIRFPNNEGPVGQHMNSMPGSGDKQ